MKSLSLIVIAAGSALLTACETHSVTEHRRYSYSEPVRYRRVYYGEPGQRVYYREPVRRVYYRDYTFRDYNDDLYGPDHVALRYSGAPASPAAVNLGF
jgi:hypothetical protein